MKYTPGNLPPGFEAWWKVYPRKVAKGSAVKAWDKNGCEQIAEEIIKATRNYPFSPEAQYIKHPTTFINGWCWEDAFEETGGVNEEW